jgi:hypothetical protein
MTMWYREIPPSPGDDPWQSWIKALGCKQLHKIAGEMEAVANSCENADVEIEFP